MATRLYCHQPLFYTCLLNAQAVLQYQPNTVAVDQVLLFSRRRRHVIYSIYNTDNTKLRSTGMTCITVASVETIS